MSGMVTAEWAAPRGSRPWLARLSAVSLRLTCGGGGRWSQLSLRGCAIMSDEGQVAEFSPEVVIIQGGGRSGLAVPPGRLLPGEVGVEGATRSAATRPPTYAQPAESMPLPRLWVLHRGLHTLKPRVTAELAALASSEGLTVREAFERCAAAAAREFEGRSAVPYALAYGGGCVAVELPPPPPAAVPLAMVDVARGLVRVRGAAAGLIRLAGVAWC